MSLGSQRGSFKKKSDNRKIGIMGGTFDPIHYGHLLAAEEACFELDLEEVIFVPTGDPYHKRQRYVTSAEDRYNMVLLTTIENPDFKVSKVEIDRKEPSHTVDTLKEMRHWYAPEEVFFYFITGLDAFLDMPKWKEYRSIFELCKIVAVSRPGYTSHKLVDLPTQVQKSVIPLEIPLLSISSTEIRNRVRKQKNIRYLVPPLVEKYISKKKLYSANGR